MNLEKNTGDPTDSAMDQLVNGRKTGGGASKDEHSMREAYHGIFFTTRKDDERLERGIPFRQSTWCIWERKISDRMG